MLLQGICCKQLDVWWVTYRTTASAALLVCNCIDSRAQFVHAASNVKSTAYVDFGAGGGVDACIEQLITAAHGAAVAVPQVPVTSAATLFSIPQAIAFHPHWAPAVI